MRILSRFIGAGLGVALALGAFGTHAERRIAVGSAHVSEGEPRYGRYSGIVDAGDVTWVDLDFSGDVWSMTARDIGRDTVNVELAFNADDSQVIRAAFRKIPHHQFDDGATPFLTSGGNTLRLPASWLSSSDTTEGMTNLESALQATSFSHDRERLEVEYKHQLSRRLQLEASVDHELREGREPLGAMIGSSGGNGRAAIVASEIDETTTRAEASLRYNGERTAAGASWHLSRFNNKAAPLVWQNPFGQQAQWASGVGWPDGTGRLSLDPDNQFRQLRIFGSHILSPTVRANAAIAWGRTKQDEAFLPYSVNDNLASSEPLPAIHLDGHMDTLSVQSSLSWQPARRWNVKFDYRLDDRDNRSRRLALRSVPGDSQTQVDIDDTELNRPYSFSEATFGMDIAWRANRNVTMKAGYEETRINRDFSEVNDSKERTYELGGRIRATSNIRLSIDIERHRRAGEPYIHNRPLIRSHLPGTISPDDFENHPRLRKYYLADRDRTLARMRADWFVSDDVDLGASATTSRFDYDGNAFGLNETRQHSLVIDASWRPTDFTQVGGYLAADRYEQTQSGRSFTAAPGQAEDSDRNWRLAPDDGFFTANLSLEAESLQRYLRDWRGQLDAGLELSVSRTRTDMAVSAGPALEVAPLPKDRTNVVNFRLFGRYDFPNAGLVEMTWARERYRSDDLRLDGVAPNTMLRVLSLGEASHDYSVTWLGVTYIHTFD